MTELQMIGSVVTTVITLGAFIAVIMKFMQPINDLKVVIQELKDCVKALKEDRDAIRKRVEKHGEEIDKLDRRVGDLELKMKLHHKE
jgi:predicted  nucleic acid-binding Zn-ribbon protein